VEKMEREERKAWGRLADRQGWATSPSEHYKFCSAKLGKDTQETVHSKAGSVGSAAAFSFDQT